MQPQVKKAKILVVDDDKDLLEMIQEIIGSVGHKVVTATDGVDGTFKYTNEKFDLIITDIKMPKKDGIKFLQHIQITESQEMIKLGNKYKPLPIIVISASVEDYKVELELFPNLNIITKPFSPKEILDKVASALDSASAPGTVSSSSVLLKTGEYLLKEGDLGNDLFLVKSGGLRILKKSQNNTEVVICQVGPGEIIGEMGFLLHKNRTASVIAIQDSELISIPKDKFDKILSTQPRWFKVLFETLAQRLEKTTQQLVEEKVKNQQKA